MMLGSNESPLTEEDPDDKQEETTPVTAFNKGPEAVHRDPVPEPWKLGGDRWRRQKEDNDENDTDPYDFSYE